jgi:pyruvate kinase
MERVPGAQKFIIDQANYRGTPVITATQMLRSMVKDLRPTRAEVTDVCTAVRDGTDAVMLSEETAVGLHPIQAVQALHRICSEAEREFEAEAFGQRFKGQDRSTVPDAICFAAAYASSKISAGAVVACTQSGSTGRLMAKYRPLKPLFGVTTERKTLNRMSLYWGVEPVLIELAPDSSTEDEIIQALVALRDQYGLKPGSRVVLTAGLRSKSIGATNLMEIREIPRTA